MQQHVTLVSSDGFEFIVSTEAASVSGTLKASLSDNFIESDTRKIVLDNMTGELLEKVCDYLMYNYKYSKYPNAELPEFEIPPEIALQLYVAADYLNV
ncbi:hypothetical protein CANCADRAFT_24566 [Tortispora caseinolytica NRRL Y-17796]|uniref:Elongin-C n=1 Tax=Tortispora caseinolytica NRRL Y-17796 TaxID=767744 RepID=A0A1E4THZ7_9ASCO|nr:hypothetical protein CANCADRAFT_24566 [Tortispora caseinolytica NRRL Y-17796]